MLTRFAIVVNLFGFSKGELAAKLGITPSHMSRLLAGQHRPSDELQYRISDELWIPANTLF